ncbi:MAG: hypothetical protein ACXWJ7_04625 [Caldimonas sp.]
MPVQLKDLQDKTKYKKALKEELTSLKATPSVFHYFEKFKFDDGKLGPLLLVGDLMRKDLFESVKNTDAPIKARGKCAKAGEKVQFQTELGTLPLDKLKADMSNVDSEEVKKLGGGDAAAPADAALKGAAEAKLGLVTKQFNAIKGRVNDEDRKAMHEIFGRVAKAMEAGKYGEAITEMKAAELACAKAGNALRQDQADKENAAARSFEESATVAKASLKQATTTEAEVKRLVEEIKSTEQKAGAAASKKGSTSQANAVKLQSLAKDLKTQLDSARESMSLAQKTKDADQNVLKAMASQLLAAQVTYDLAANTLAAPGKLADNAGMKEAQDAISAKVGEMSAATKFQQEQVKGDGHGTGRHGAQTGIEGQARRVASDVTPDQEHNPGGTAMRTAQWKTTIKWKEVEVSPGKMAPERDSGGKRIVDKPAQIVQKVIDEVGNTFATKTSSMFLNPALEHEAVLKAIEIAGQCTWTQWNKAGTWTDLTSLTIVVPPPKTAKGYGLAVGRAEGFVKQAAAAAAAHVKDFETGKVKTIDELMKLLNVEIQTDRTGEGAALIPHARVVLERANTGAEWKAKTYFPTADPPGWQCAKDVPLTGKSVRGPGNGPPVVAPDYAR